MRELQAGDPTRIGPYYAPVLDAADADEPWLSTAYKPGPSLHAAVAEQGPLPAEAVRVLAGGLAEALAAPHDARGVHRDLKPSNVCRPRTVRA
ncbi:hypothetical protein [Embleya sp. NPDC005575]|uniref:hypothetical protein n=1 Tax=Embleya sp. NPDC005575 TaxID=3156892 RepID=UPI0033B6E479